MVKKYDLITDLYAEAVKEVSASPENWMAFLRSACRNYRLPFDEQLLVYKQRPEAVAVLGMEDWNRKFGRWVKRDSKGIAVFDKRAGAMRLKYYFDVSDTKEGRYRRLLRPVPLWEVGEEYQKEVEESLANAFAVSDSMADLEATILEAAKNVVEDNLSDYLPDILDGRKNSFLEELDAYSTEVEIKKLLSASVAYMVMIRCGIDAGLYLDSEDFSSIRNLNTLELVNLFGTVNSDVSEMVLSEVGDTIRKLQMEEGQRDRTIAEENEGQYTENNKVESQILIERGSEYDSNKNRIQPAGRLSTAKFDGSRRSGNLHWEVRLSPQEIPEGRTLWGIHKSADAGKAEPAPTGDTGRSTGDEGTADRGTETVSERNGRIESEGSDYVAGISQQYSSDSGGNRDAGTGLQLEWHDRSSEDKEIPFFGKETDIKELLLSTPHLKATKAEIKDFYERHEDKTERIEYIRGIFNHEYTELTLEDGRRVGYKTYQNVLHIWEGSYPSQTAQAYYNWGVIADFYEGMRVLGELWDKMKPMPTVQEQLSMMEDLAGEKIPAFSFSQEIIDVMLRSGGSRQEGKYRIYSYFLQGHTNKEKAEFLKNEYGVGGCSSILIGTGIGEDHDSRGLKLHRGYGSEAPALLLKWSRVAKRIDELIEANRYMTEKEKAGIPEYEKRVLAREIYSFYHNQPENIIRPYPQGGDYDTAEHEILQQLDNHERMEELLVAMQKVVANTADFASNYEFMKNTCNAVSDYLEGKYSLFTPLSGEREGLLPKLEADAGQELKETIEKAQNPPLEDSLYDLKVGIIIFIGTDKYEIQFLSDDTVVLQDITYPLFTKEMSRKEFERKVRENPANNHLKVKEELPEMLVEQLAESLDTEDINGQDVECQDGNQEKEDVAADNLIPVWLKHDSLAKPGTFDLHPEIPQADRNQYQITDDELGQGTAKEKFRANIVAIQMLKKCEEEGRYATAEEQREWLSKYVGWGGLADTFDETKSVWGTEYLELKSVLTAEEYEAARGSTLTAFYTPPVVIRAMYQALENMGLKSGNILEPSCGVGNFIGMKPESLSDCRIYGVELDSISGRIAGQLYQKSAIAVQGFEETDLPDSFFDVAIGNVPFGQFKISDKRYDKHNFLVHDYFFAKALDKVRPGGVIAFITASGTMDKKNPAIRKYIAQRAELLGAVRLPNNTFKKNAGTEVTADILFLQKRDRLVETKPDWLYLDTDENGITQNSYFVSHPEMVLGKMVMESTRFGMNSACRAYEDSSLDMLLQEAVSHIHAEISEYKVSEIVEENDYTIPADPSVANFSYTVLEGQIYYRENSRMKLVEISVTGANRIKGMVAIRDCVRDLIAYQTEGYSDHVIEKQQKELNQLYDIFCRKYGLLNARANNMVFSDDGSYPLLCSLEILAEDGTLERKADMFTKRTIKPHEAVTKVDTASEALSLSLSEKACVDMDYMCSLTGKNAEEIEQELRGVIFRLPDISDSRKQPQYMSEDEYLSGNVREKLKTAQIAAKSSEIYKSNVEALEKIQPKDLSASEISVRLGATWIPISDVSDFIFQLLNTPNYNQWNIKVHFSKYTGEWNIEGKSVDRENVKANNTYGTHRANAYKIIEDTLNLRDTRIYDYYEDEDGKRKAVLNKTETAIAQGKQDLIKQAFQDWIWKNPERRRRLTAFYNEKFNAIRPRKYDGSHLKFYGMNPEIQLRRHQINGAARIIYGGNTLLAYVVGAGKTYTMVAAAMESKRLGLCSKSMVVVPNHIIEQFSAEWLQLYPAANLLVASKKDFETKNRKKFCARIATSNIDGVIIGHSQFEKIPLSIERQKYMLETQIEEIMDGIAEAKGQQGSRFTVKQLEKSKKTLLVKLNKLNDQSRKDDVVCFEQLGVDRLFVDEADSYKNLYLYTKMRNVGGIAQTEAQKSSDMFMKCRYLDEITGGRGVIFATGTPVSNSMTELYTMQRYLQYPALVKRNLQHFDAWASTFGETVTAIELAPEGSGYRLKTRFARFYNLPELMMMFQEVADIQTADMLKLPVPEAEYRVVTIKPSKIQKEMVEKLGDRAERVRNGMVNPSQDNMLLITNDGRKLALDQRLTNELLPDEKESKVNACVEEVYRYWEQGKEKKLTQLLFCDLSVPKTDGSFSVYNDIRDKLISRGIPADEIEFIHNADTDVRKKELFAKVRRGAVRILMGSTFKMGAGTNVQNLIIASHDLDCPWRPRDLTQRAGRSIRQGNQNKKVDIIRYVTEGTFDAYLYQVIENKQKFISQIMTSKSPVRTIEDVDETALSYAEIKALATGNPHIKEKMDLDIQVSKLQLLKQNFLSQKYEMEDKVAKTYPEEIENLEERIRSYQEDIALVKEHTPSDRGVFPDMIIYGKLYSDKQEAGKAVIEACKAMTSPDAVMIGSYRGLAMDLQYNTFRKEFIIILKGKLKHQVELGYDIYGNITRLDNKIEQFEDNLFTCMEKLEIVKMQLETAKEEVVKAFPQEKELAEKLVRLERLNALLDIDKKENMLLDSEPDEKGWKQEKNNNRLSES